MANSSEITAEWTVTAKLRLVRPGDSVRHQSVPRTSQEKEGSKVYYYKWCSENPNQPVSDNFDNSHQVRFSFFLLCLNSFKLAYGQLFEFKRRHDVDKVSDLAKQKKMIYQ